MRWFAITTFLVLSCGFVFAQAKPEVKYIESQPLKLGSYRGYARLSVNKTTVKLGGQFNIDIRFVNNSSGDYFYNPFFNRVIPLPAQLAIFDKDKKYLGDLIDQSGSPVTARRAAMSTNDWVFIPSGGYLGVTFGPIQAGNTPAFPRQTLKAGDYYLQMIFYKGFVEANRANAEKPSINVFLKGFSRKELFRSNVVKIRIK